MSRHSRSEDWGHISWTEETGTIFCSYKFVFPESSRVWRVFPEHRFLAEPRAGSGGSAIKMILCPPGTASHNRFYFLKTLMLFRAQNLSAHCLEPLFEPKSKQRWSGCVNWRCWPRAWLLGSPKHGDHCWGKSSMFCWLPLPQLLPPVRLVVSLQGLGLGNTGQDCGAALVAACIAVSRA